MRVEVTIFIFLVLMFALYYAFLMIKRYKGKQIEIRELERLTKEKVDGEKKEEIVEV